MDNLIPITKKERLLAGEDLDPVTRFEWFLKKAGQGGGDGGTTNYNLLSNLPQIGGRELKGNKTAAQLGLQDALTFDTTPTQGSTNPVTSGGIYNVIGDINSVLEEVL